MNSNVPREIRIFVGGHDAFVTWSFFLVNSKHAQAVSSQKRAVVIGMALHVMHWNAVLIFFVHAGGTYTLYTYIL